MTDMTGQPGDGAGGDPRSADGREPRPPQGAAGRQGSAGQDRQSRASRPRPGGPGQDMLSDLQRWLLRSSAKNMRNQIGDQVRKTLGGRRPEPGDVWDTATTEIPPEVGESPECQWCPICRAARRMRESSPGLGSPLIAASDAVAAAVQDALSGLESLFARRAEPGDNPAAGPRWTGEKASWTEARDEWAAQHGAPVARPPRPEPAAELGEANGSAPGAVAGDDAADGPDEPDDRG